MALVARNLPLLLWIALAALLAMVGGMAYLGVTATPLLLPAALVPAFLGYGIAHGRPWAPPLAFLLLAAHGGTLLLGSASVLALAGLAVEGAIVVPVLATWRFFYPLTGLEGEVGLLPPNPSRPKQLLLVLLLCLFLLGGSRLVGPTLTLRDRYGLTVNPVREGVPPKVVLMTTALGAFRGIFIDLLWLRAMAMKEEGKFFEMVQLYDWITNLQPNYSMVWRFAAWDLAYNVSVEHDDLQDRWFWVYRGIRYLRDKGIPYNRNDPELYAELSWIYYHKIGASMDYAHKLYRTELAREMHQVLGGPGDRELLAALVALPADEEALRALPAVAWLAERLAPYTLDPVRDFRALAVTGEGVPEGAKAVLAELDAGDALEAIRLFRLRQVLEGEYHLDPNIMLELNNRYGPVDWRGSDAHALYWAHLGRRKRYEQIRRQRELKGIDAPIIDMKYERLVYFSLQRMADRGRILITGDGIVYNTPDYRFVAGAVRHMRDLLARSRQAENTRGRDVNIKGLLSGYTYLLERCIMLYYFNGRVDETGPFLESLRAEHPEKEAYQATPEAFVQENIKEWIDSMSVRRYHAVVEGFLRQTYLYLAMGNRNAATEQERWARELYEYARKRWKYNPDVGDQQYKYVTPLADMSADLLVRILDGEEPLFTPKLVARLKAIFPPERIEEARRRARSDAPPPTVVAPAPAESE